MLSMLLLLVMMVVVVMRVVGVGQVGDGVVATPDTVAFGRVCGRVLGCLGAVKLGVPEVKVGKRSRANLDRIEIETYEYFKLVERKLNNAEKFM